MANKVDVFTEELSKVFTILQQQYVMIKYMKALITSGELDETEIGKLKEQVTLINSNVNDINTTKLDKITTSGDNRVYGISSIGNQTNYSIGYYVNNLLPGYLARYNDSGRLSTPTPQSNNDCANKKYVDDTVASAGGGGKLYRHDLIITNMNDFQIYHTIYATTDTPITTDQIFATVVKANSDYGGQGMYLDSNVKIQNALIRYSTGRVVVQTSTGGLAPAKSITDTVTPV